MTNQNPRDQRETVRDKGGTTSGPRGLQQWTDDEVDAEGGDAAGGHGKGSDGTAARQDRIGHMAPKKEPASPEDGSS